MDTVASFSNSKGGTLVIGDFSLVVGDGSQKVDGGDRLLGDM